MPYKDPQKRKESAKRRYLLNIDKIKARAIQWYADNKETVLKQHAEKSEQLKDECKKWRENNKEHRKEYKKKNAVKEKQYCLQSAKKARADLKDWYVAEKIKIQTGLTIEQIKKHPELIENHRQQIKFKRLIKQIKNGK